jgi:hypothetical protein
MFQLDAEQEKTRSKELSMKELELSLEGERKRKQLVDDSVKELRKRIADQAKQIFEKEQEIDLLKVRN